MNLFGKKKEQPKPVDVAGTIAFLQTTQEKLEKREQHLASEVAIAKAEGKKKMKAKDMKGKFLLTYPIPFF